MKTTLTVKTTVISLLALMVVACAAAGVGAQQALPSQDVKSLAGKWVGWMTPSNQVMEVQIQPDGSYTSVRGTTTGQGTIKMDGGKLMADGHLITGPNVTTAGPEKAQLTLSSKAGKQVLSGTGRDNEGPYSFQLTKQ
jgi:hypothetical protein